MATKIVFTFKEDGSRKRLVERSEKLVRTGPPFKLEGHARSIQFLRGVFSRASMCIPAFHYFLGSASAYEAAKTSSDHEFRLAQSYSEFSDLNTLTLSCRKVFDHGIKQDLTGANFAKTSDSTLSEHADYWAKAASRDASEAYAALTFLRTFFSLCSKTDTDLLQSDSQLQRRIGLLKQHADRSAAHLSLDNYSIEITDLVHFTGAIAIVGEIIRSFDRSSLQASYFNDLDLASHKNAKRIFPQIANFRLFGHMKVEQQARAYWKFGEEVGIPGILNNLHNALGGDPDQDK